MTAAAALLLVTLLDLRTRQPAMAGLLFTAVGAAMALGALALFLPSVAVGLNRLLFALWWRLVWCCLRVAKTTV